MFNPIKHCIKKLSEVSENTFLTIAIAITALNIILMDVLIFILLLIKP